MFDCNQGQDMDSDTIVPALLARDMLATLAFYELLGFTLVGCEPDRNRPTWMELRRAGAVLQFHSDPPMGTLTGPAMSGTIYVRTTNVRALAASIRGRIDFEWEPDEMEYGQLEFGVKDPNGYFVAFAQTG
ncbi:MAG: hypothetical protein JNJ55_09840 [Betaproteobacteria bacterium]|nr:hypothetical protein [Betaproteobacteria bacterium]